MKNKISLVTSWGNEYGTGHMHRMITLLWYFTTNNIFEVELVSRYIPSFFPTEFLHLIKHKVSSDTDLIIRDMRNSTAEDIEQYDKKVVVIDDNGDGRLKATKSIYLLPNLYYNDDVSKNMFIYGYNFIKSLVNLNNTIFKKDIDFTIYPVHNNKDYAKDIIKFLPKESKIAVLIHNDSYIIHNKEIKIINNNEYASIILRTKTLISHFGILLFEAYIASCKLITINPTNYCYLLSQLIKNEMLVINFGNLYTINKQTFIDTISNLKLPDNAYISVDSIYSKLLISLEKFSNCIKELL